MGLAHLATLTIFGLYCLRSSSNVFIVFPVSIISLTKKPPKKQRSYFSNFGSRVFCCISVKSQTYLHNQDILCTGKKKKSFLIHQINSTRVYILHNNVALTLPVNVDRSSPPMTLISPVDWSFC